MNVKLSVVEGNEQLLVKSLERLMSPKPTETRWALVDQEKVLEIQRNRKPSPGVMVKMSMHKRHRTIVAPPPEPVLEDKTKVPTKPFSQVSKVVFDKVKDFRSKSRSRGLRTLQDSQGPHVSIPSKKEYKTVEGVKPKFPLKNMNLNAARVMDKRNKWASSKYSECSLTGGQFCHSFIIGSKHSTKRPNIKVQD